MYQNTTKGLEHIPLFNGRSNNECVWRIRLKYGSCLKSALDFQGISSVVFERGLYATSPCTKNNFLKRILYVYYVRFDIGFLRILTWTTNYCLIQKDRPRHTMTSLTMANAPGYCAIHRKGYCKKLNSIHIHFYRVIQKTLDSTLEIYVWE